MNSVDEINNAVKNLPLAILKNKAFFQLVGQIIFNHLKGSLKGVDLWRECFGDLYEEDFYSNVYSTFKITHHTYSSVNFYLKNDKVAKEIIEQNDIEDLEFLSCVLETCNHQIISKYIFKKYKEVLVSDNKKRNKELFMFDVNLNYWHSVGTEFITKEFDNMIKFGHESIKKFYRDMMESHDEAFREKMENLGKKFSKSISFLAERSCIDKVFRSIRDYATDYLVENKWDSLYNYTGTQNGVLICQGEDVFFRMSVPEDFITKRVSANYTKDPSKLGEFLDWFGKLFPSDEVRHFVYKSLSSLLVSGNFDKIVFFLSGETGHNSKSCFLNCIFMLLGLDVYASKVPPTLFTERLNKAHECNEAMFNLCNSRIASFDEPEEGHEFFCGTFKVVSGNDFSSVRRLYKSNATMQIQSTIFAGMNRVPSFADCDDAVKRRICIIPFLTRWSDDAPKSEEEQREQRIYKMDPDFISNINAGQFSEALLYMMVEMFPFWSKEKLTNRPKEIKEISEAYWNETDFYNSWVKFSFRKYCDKEYRKYKDQNKNKPTKSNNHVNIKINNDIEKSDEIDDHETKSNVRLAKVEELEYSSDKIYNDFCRWFKSRTSSKRMPDFVAYSRHVSQILGLYRGDTKRYKDYAYIYNSVSEIERQQVYEGGQTQDQSMPIFSMSKINPTLI